MDAPLTPQQVSRNGIGDITSAMIADAKSGGRRYKLVCSAERRSEGVIAAVRPQMVDVADPLFGMEDSTTGVAFRTDVLGDYCSFH